MLSVVNFGALVRLWSSSVCLSLPFRFVLAQVASARNTDAIGGRRHFPQRVANRKRKWKNTPGASFGNHCESILAVSGKSLLCEALGEIAVISFGENAVVTTRSTSRRGCEWVGGQICRDAKRQRRMCRMGEKLGREVRSRWQSGLIHTHT